MKKILYFLLLIVFTFTLTSCREKRGGSQNDGVELTYYKMYDDEDDLASLIDEWELENNVVVHYKKFNDYEEYQRTILNEMAEGEGPDVFSMPNTWFTSNYRKITPMDDSFVLEGDSLIDAFREMFVDVASKDLIRTDYKGIERVYALPMTVDTLALYYNKDHFEDRIPSQGKPSNTWDGIKDDVLLLNRYNEETDNFLVAGIAMGRSDNLSRGVDVLYLLFLQFGLDFYNDNMSQAIFSERQGSLKYPALEALDLFTLFADPDQKYYSWNEYVANAALNENEELAFARGDLSMMIGFSYSYENILNYIELLNLSNDNPISKNDVYVMQIPQLEDPDASSASRVTYANYFAETVSRNCEYPELAWSLLLHLTKKDSLDFYFDKTHNPTSRRDMLDDQISDPTYGVFASQTGFAESFPIVDYLIYKDVFSQVISDATSSGSSHGALVSAEGYINSLLPEEGILTAIAPIENEEEK